MERDYPLVIVTDGRSEQTAIASASLPTLLDALGTIWSPRRRKRDNYYDGPHWKALALLMWACPPVGEYAGRLLGTEVA